MKTFWIIIFLFLSTAAIAKEQYPGQYANVDEKTKAWYQSLENKQGVLCCSKADCHEAEMAYKDGVYYAILPEGMTLAIPPEAITDEKFERTNPTGSAVVCYHKPASEYETANEPEYQVRCFVRGNWI